MVRKTAPKITAIRCYDRGERSVLNCAGTAGDLQPRCRVRGVGAGKLLGGDIKGRGDSC